VLKPQIPKDVKKASQMRNNTAITVVDKIKFFQVLIGSRYNQENKSGALNEPKSKYRYIGVIY